MIFARDLIISLLLAVVLGLGVPLAVFRWARWLAQRPGAPRIIVALPYVVIVTSALNVVVAAVMSVIVISEFGGDTRERATTLARAISTAINCYSFGLLALLGIAVVLVPITMVRRR